MTTDTLVNSPFFNRELSWLEFNQRVLEEAKDPKNPLFERIKFLGIAGSNLDEFFMIRVASLQDQVDADFEEPDPSGLTPKEQLAEISLRAHKQVVDMYNCYNRTLKKSLAKEEMFFLNAKELNNHQLDFVREYYINHVFPVLTPMVVDKSQPFPLILNKTLNIALLLEENASQENTFFGTIQVPSVLERYIEVPSLTEKRYFIFLEDIIKMNLTELFGNYQILAAGCFRITRNADLDVVEDEADDLLTAVQISLRQRKWGSAIRLEIESDLHPVLLKILEEELTIYSPSEYSIKGPLDLSFLTKLSNLAGFDALRYKPLKPRSYKNFADPDDFFETISAQDFLLHHPYDSFDIVVDLVKKAAEDPDVLAIKQTLYRVSSNSPIVEALAQAADNGKQVTVLLELKARFDEQNNITMAKKLETAGCHVIYGLLGLKTHCKLLLIVRREESQIKRYVHLGTGNYNDVTARVYSDFGLLTANPYFAADASAVFNTLSGCSSPTPLYKLTMAPLNLRKKFLTLIRNETEAAQEGRQAKIIIKINSLTDTEIIQALYEASAAGVEIDLIVRGICRLRPGLPGVSENIRVKSIVGRFLEHSRIYYFYTDGQEQIYLSSADLMRRNLDRRVELLFPVDDPDARKEIMTILKLQQNDTVKTRILNSDGSYTRISSKRKTPVNSQEVLLELQLKGENSASPLDFTPIISYQSNLK